MMKKYEITDIAHPHNSSLRRIRAIVAIAALSIMPGDLGGYVESEENLSHDGNAWVCGDAWVYGNAQVCGDARVYGDASIIWISRIGSENGTLTVFTGKSGLLAVRGCFYGSLDEFAAAVTRRHGGSQIAAEYELAINLCRLRLADAQAKIDSGEAKFPEEKEPKESI